MDRILIIEDDPVIRETVEYNLAAAGFSVIAAADGRTGLEKVAGDRPDLILLDLLLPELDGLTLCRKIRERDDDVRIIMITALGTDRDKITGLTVGADDYITKPFNIDELLARIRAQLRRKAPSTAGQPRELSFGDVQLDPVKYELTVNGRQVRLRPKEFQLLLTLASNPGLVFSRIQLATAIWGINYLGSSRTIDVHIQRLREKAEKPSAFTFIATVHGLGYRFELTPKPTLEMRD